MTFLNSLSDDGTSILVIDTSMLINLERSRIGKQIFQTINSSFVATEQVANESTGLYTQFTW